MKRRKQNEPEYLDVPSHNVAGQLYYPRTAGNFDPQADKKPLYPLTAFLSAICNTGCDDLSRDPVDLRKSALRGGSFCGVIAYGLVHEKSVPFRAFWLCRCFSGSNIDIGIS